MVVGAAEVGRTERVGWERHQHGLRHVMLVQLQANPAAANKAAVEAAEDAEGAFSRKRFRKNTSSIGSMCPAEQAGPCECP